MTSANFNDLREYLEYCRNIDELKEINSADWNLEIGAITEVMAEQKGPALVFDNIKDYASGYRVASNLFASYQRTAAVLRLPLDASPLEMLNQWRHKVREFAPVPPREVETGPVMENIASESEVDLFKFPTPRWHEKDGGRYLGTACSVITRDPEEGWVNLGTHRCQIHDRNTLGVLLVKGKHGRIMMDKYHARGESCPVAIVFGQDPTLWAAASYQIPWGISEYDFTGWLAGKPVEVIKGEYTGLPLPATAEIVIEGEIPPADQIQDPPTEGPFGEWMGYFAATGGAPVVKVKRVYHRNNPIIQGAPPLKPPRIFHFALPLMSAGAVWDQLERLGIPDIKGVWQMVTNWGSIWLVIAVKQRYEGHAKQAAVAATTTPAGVYGGKFTVVVDDDVDITDPEDVLWAVGSRCDGEKDIDIIRGLWTTPCDPSVPEETMLSGNISNARVIINGCRPYNRLGSYPEVNVFDKAYKQQIKEKFGL